MFIPFSSMPSKLLFNMNEAKRDDSDDDSDS